jgi:hypothetical protein
MFLGTKLASTAAGPRDSNFENVTLLLNGNGTNGAQNNTFLDSSQNNFTITRNGNTTQGSFSPYGNGWSNYFDGIDDYLSPTSSANLNVGTGQFTIEAWIFVTANAGNYQAIYIFGPAQYDGLYFVSNSLVFYQTNAVIQFGSIPLSTWTHVAATRDASNNLRLFVNGVASTATSFTYNLTDNQPRIGTNKATVAGEHFNGYISNLRLLKGTALYTTNFTPPTSPLTAITNTQLLTCQNNRLVDNSSNNFTITKNGDVSVQRLSPFSPSVPYSASTLGGSMYFDGSDYLSIASNAAFNFGTGDFTVEAWIYSSTIAAGQGVIFGRQEATTNAVFQFRRNSDKIELIVRATGGGGLVTLTSSTSITTNSWVHVAAVRSSGTATIYINGVASGSISAGTNTDPSVARPFTIGVLDDTSLTGYFSGYISNARIIKGTALYTGNFTPPTVPLTAITNTQLLLNGTNAAIFDSAMQNDIETVGQAQISTVQSKFGTGSIFFDGNTDVLNIPDSPNLRILSSGDFTVECWIYPTAVPASNGPLISKTANAAGYVLRVNNVSGSIRAAWVIPGVAEYVFGPASLATNTWHHIAVCRVGTVVTGYVNGTQYTFTSTNRTVDTTTITEIGGSRDTGAGAFYFTGYIDDVRITKGLARYTANFTPPTEQLPNY